MQKTSSITILTLSQILWWGSLLVCYLIDPSILNNNEVMSLYGTLPDTLWIFGFGLVSSGVLTLVLARRTNEKIHPLLRLATYIVGITSILLPFFRLDGGTVSNSIHGLLAGALFFTEFVTTVVVAQRIGGRAMNIFTAIAIFSFASMILSSELLGVLDLLLFGEFAVPITFGVWLQFVLRKKLISL